MRQDMTRILRETHTGRHLAFQGRKVELVDGEPRDVGRMPMRPREQGWDDIVHARYAPLHRFLASRVGQPWGQVYAEASARFVRGRGMWMTVRQWLSKNVSQNVFRNAAGDLVFGSQYGGVRLVSYNDYYVDPDTGLLCSSRNERRGRTCWKEHLEARAAAKALVFREGAEGLQYHKRDGIWFEVQLADIRLLAAGRSTEEWYPYDAFLKQRVYGSDSRSSERTNTYGQAHLYSVGHRALGRREVKRLGLP